MIRIILAFTVLMAANVTESYAKEITFLSPDVKVMSVQTSEVGRTVVVLEYELPCWATYVDIISKDIYLGNPINPGTDFQIALGVLLKGEDMNPCMGSSKVRLRTEVNTYSPEGKFKGFKIIKSL